MRPVLLVALVGLSASGQVQKVTITKTGTGGTSAEVVSAAPGATATGLVVHVASLPAGGSTQYAEDSTSADAEQVMMCGAIRKDAQAAISGSDGDRTELQTNATGGLRVDGSAVTQPVSGTFWQVTQPVSGTFWQVTQPISGTVTTAPPSNASSNVAQLAGTTTDTNSGLKSAGTLRVVLATDQPALTNKLLVTPDSVALPANQSVNVAQINGITTLMGNGGTGTGSQRVTIASDNTAFTVNAAESGTWSVRSTGNAGAAFDAANNAAMPANALAVGVQTATIDATPTAATAGNLRYGLASTEGVVYVQEGGPKRFSCFLQGVTVLTQCQAAPASGLRAYVTSFHASNQAVTISPGQEVDVRFGPEHGSNLYQGEAQSVSGTQSIHFIGEGVLT